jgi:hypothetical protein
MYILEQLQRRLLGLKEIGSQLNVLPRAISDAAKNWIDAIVGVNPPLLQLLKLPPHVCC